MTSSCCRATSVSDSGTQIEHGFRTQAWRSARSVDLAAGAPQVRLRIAWEDHRSNASNLARVGGSKKLNSALRNRNQNRRGLDRRFNWGIPQVSYILSAPTRRWCRAPRVGPPLGAFETNRNTVFARQRARLDRQSNRHFCPESHVSLHVEHQQLRAARRSPRRGPPRPVRAPPPNMAI